MANVSRSLNVWNPYSSAGDKSPDGNWTLVGKFFEPDATNQARLLMTSGMDVHVAGQPEAQKEVWSKASSSGPGGSAGSSGGRSSGAQALEATQAGQRQITGGGQGFAIGGASVGADIPVRENEFKGIDSATPDNKLAPNFVPRSMNWDAFRRFGSRGVRDGIAKLADDIGTVHDGSTATTTVTCVAKANITASSDSIIFRIANGTTHAFWFDTTGGDTEPTESQSADASTTVDISAGVTTAAQVAAALHAAINGASIGVTSNDGAGDGTSILTASTNGYLFYAEANVTNSGFTLPNFTVSGSALSSEYRGLSILPLPASGGASDQLLYCFSDKDVEIGSAPGGSNSATNLTIVDTGPRWGRPRDLSGLPGPTLALSDQGSQVLRVNAVYTNVFPAAQAELMKQSVKAITIRIVGPFSGATPRYPLDIDGEDGTGSVLFVTSGPSNVDRRTYDGTTTNFDMDLSAATYGAGKYWVSCWAVGPTGTSEASNASLTLA